MTVASHLDRLKKQAADLPILPGVYLYKDAAGKVLYIGKAKSLRDRVQSYFTKDRLLDAKTGGLLAEAHDIDHIVVGNEKEALALEDNLIKERQPRFNVLLRDDKTYPFIKLTKERFPRVYVTRRLKKDGSIYFGPYFPASLAHRLVNFIHRYFKIPSCRVDLTRFHPRPCLEYHIHRCWGPCVEGLTTDEIYTRAARNVRMFLEGRQNDLVQDLRSRMMEASNKKEFEQAAALRDLISTVDELAERQRVATVEGRDIDIFGLHAETPLVAVNLFHVRSGRIVDRREFYWEDAHEAHPAEFLASLLKQIYLSRQYVPSFIHVPIEFDDQGALQEFLTEKRGRKVEIVVPRRGPKKAMLELVQNNTRHGFEQRFRVMKPTPKEMMAALTDALNQPETVARIECFDISHIQGRDTVASMVVWENGRMKRSDYRKFILKGVVGIDDFASLKEVVARRYGRLQKEGKSMPGLVLVDGGIGQLHAAAQALEQLDIINQPLAAIAKREETIFVQGQEDEPVKLERFSPILHLVQMIRDEAHRFALRFHRSRRHSRQLTSLLRSIPGVGEMTVRKLLTKFGSLEKVRGASLEELLMVVNRKQAQNIQKFLAQNTTLS